MASVLLADRSMQVQQSTARCNARGVSVQKSREIVDGHGCERVPIGSVTIHEVSSSGAGGEKRGQQSGSPFRRSRISPLSVDGFRESIGGVVLRHLSMCLCLSLSVLCVYLRVSFRVSRFD